MQKALALVVAGVLGVLAASAVARASYHEPDPGYGTAPATTATTTTGAGAAVPRGTRTLVAFVGPQFAISLKTGSGGKVGALAAGRYRIVVHDRSAVHNFRLAGPAVSKSTGVAFTGSVAWTVRLRRGMYRYRCDPHSSDLRGSFRVR